MNSTSNSGYIRFLEDIHAVSDTCSTRTYVWGGFTMDIMEGRFLRGHKDLDCFTLNLTENLDALMGGYAARGYETGFIGDIGMLEIRRDGLHACFNELSVMDGLAMWRHIGTEGTVHFPAGWLDPDPRPFYGILAYTAGSNFEFAIKSNVRMINAEWEPRPMDLEALEYHRASVVAAGGDPDRVLGMVWSHNPFWVRMGYPDYVGLRGAGPAFPPLVRTIGHSNMPQGEFIELLESHGILHVADVRSVPLSRYCPHFNREPLGRALESAGIVYSFYGDLLGGRINDPECYRDRVVNIRRTNHASQLDAGVVFARPWFRRGLLRVLERAVHVPTAVMCSEEDPFGCHRHLLVARALTGLGVPVAHIRRREPMVEALFQRDLP